MKRAVAEHAHPAHPHDVLMPKKRHFPSSPRVKPVVSSSPFPPARLPLFSLENDGEDEEEEGGDDDAYGAVAVI